jgi:DUF1707 SHOCT-like domain
MSTPYVWDRNAGRDPDLRAADADRERTAERLRTSHAEGRLDLAEFQQRLERCYEAKTLGQLDALVSDLPRPDEESGRLSAGRVAPWRWRLAPLVLLVALAVVLAATGHRGFFWMWIPLVILFWRMSWWRHRRWLGGSRLH